MAQQIPPQAAGIWDEENQRFVLINIHHDPRHDIAMDVMRMQTIVRAL
jgi:hypothetical protein